MTTIRDLFRKWLENKRYTPQTAYNYSMAIERISKHYSSQENRETDIYTIQDIQLLKDIVDKYDLKGKYSHFGSEGHRLNRAVIKALLKFKQSKDIDTLNNIEETEN